MRRSSRARARQIDLIRVKRYVLQVGMHCLRRICRRVNDDERDEENRSAALALLCALLHEIHGEDIELHNHSYWIARAIEEAEEIECGRVISVAADIDTFPSHVFDGATGTLSERPNLTFSALLDSLEIAR
jgi:hypothetical protein